MDLSNLKPAKGSVKQNKRLGRGQGSGRGGTSTRGNKGAKSRSGYSSKGGFEGGQMPLYRRAPKFGFKNRFRVEYSGINLDIIQKIATDNNIAVIDIETLRKHGLIAKNRLIKILGRGKLDKKVEVKAHAFSETAKAAIESLGGTVVIL